MVELAIIAQIKMERQRSLVVGGAFAEKNSQRSGFFL